MKLSRLLSLASLLACLIVASAFDSYKEGSRVEVYANRVGPYANPSVSYEYYSLPFCKKADVQHKSQHLGEKLEGDKKMTSDYNIKFKEPVVEQRLCEMHWNSENVEAMKQAIRENYYFEFAIDDLPVGGFVGYHDTSEQRDRYFVLKHLDFHISYNPNTEDGNVIINANVTSDGSKVFEILNTKGDIYITFTYSVFWHVTNKDVSERGGESHFAHLPIELEIHWLSIINSFVLVILLTGFLAIILLRILKSDFARYAKDDEEDGLDTDDYGWKLIHGDVFRFPTHRSLFSSFVGVGAQFLTMMIFILLLAVVGLYYPGNDGALVVSAVVLYALTACVGGFVSGYFYKQMGGTAWVWNTVLVATIFALPFVVIAFIINIIAVAYQSLNAIPFEAVLAVIAIWAFVGLPLTLFGGITGKRFAGQFYAPVRTKNFPREIPPVVWYRRLPFQMVMAGFLPFSAIYIELFYIFNSVWGRGSYQLWGILCLVFVILLIVTACITIALTYFQLSMEDWRWWWNAFVTGGSTGLFIYAYSIFYFIWRSGMSGLLQSAIYFGYMAIISYFFFLMLGTVGFYSSLMFTRAIYKNLHTD